MEVNKDVNKEQNEVKIIEEVSRKKDKQIKRGSGTRGSSVALIKSMSNTHTFDSTSHLKEETNEAEIARIY